MNILYIAQNAGSPRLGMEFRPYYLGRAWVSAGHRVRVVAASNAHTRARQPRMWDNAFEQQNEDGIEYIYLKTPELKEFKASSYGRSILSFVYRLFLYSRSICADFKPDIVVAASGHPFDMLAARYFARKHKARLVYEVTQLWPDSPVQVMGFDAHHALIWKAGFAQKYACRVCDAVISPLPMADVFLARYGLDVSKFHHIPNGIAPDEWDDVNADAPIERLAQAVIDSMKAQGRMLVGYAGALASSSALDVMVNLAMHMRGQKVAFLCIGDGPLRASLLDRVEAAGVGDSFVFCGPLPKRQVPAFLKQMDVLYMGAKPLGVYRYGVSFHKVYDYMMAGKPIIMALNAGNDMLADSGAGVCVDTGALKDIVAAVEDMLAKDADARAAQGARGRAYVLAHHTYEHLAKAYLEAIS